MNFQERRSAYGHLNLIDELLDIKMNSEEFLKNEKVIKKLSSIIDKIKKDNEGYTLISIVRNDKRKIILIMKNGLNQYFMYIWSNVEKISKPLELEVHDQNSRINIQETLREKLGNLMHRSALYNDTIKACLVESLTGYSINIEKGIAFAKFFNEDLTEVSLGQVPNNTITKEQMQLFELAKHLEKHGENSSIKHKNKIKEYVDRLNCSELELNISDKAYNNKLIVGKITEIIQLENKKYYKVEYISGNTQGQMYWNTKIGIVTAGTSSKDLNIESRDKCYWSHTKMSDGAFYEPDKLERIPYNLVDKGRLIVAFRSGYRTWTNVLGPDPRVEENHEEILRSSLEKALDNLSSVSLNLEDTIIETEDNNLYYSGFENQYNRENKNSGRNISNTQIRFKILKKMVDEYKYLVKKTKAEGNDVSITDKIYYNHEHGRISYNDFSISIDDELVKANLYANFLRYLKFYYRGESTEQQILDSILLDFFNRLTTRIQSNRKQSFLINIKINNAINLKLEGKKTANNNVLTYLNDQRFNKNEIIEVIKEITCYRSQDEANRFIRNIGRLGLSVYIGISTGYKITFPDGRERIFKFKKLKGRSRYELLLDDTNIPLHGKKLITILYKNFNGEQISDLPKKINQYIFDTSNNSYNYLKYKFLIDDSYNKFKNKAKEFLTKKVKDTESEFIKYNNKKSRKIMEGIRVTGSSGNNYIIAYDSVNSFVFLDPSKNNEGVYEDGKYICMIDQSNIKSNIGYDTVISKLMALRNDSSIAHTIYNLEEELDG